MLILSVFLNTCDVGSNFATSKYIFGYFINAFINIPAGPIYVRPAHSYFRSILYAPFPQMP